MMGFLQLLLLVVSIELVTMVLCFSVGFDIEFEMIADQSHLPLPFPPT